MRNHDAIYGVSRFAYTYHSTHARQATGVSLPFAACSILTTDSCTLLSYVGADYLSQTNPAAKYDEIENANEAGRVGCTPID